jgi:cholesterol 25-hydroxylase
MLVSVQSKGNRGGPSVLFPRLVLGTLLLASVFLPSLLQPALTRFYSYLYHSSFYRFSGYETIETIICYALAEIFFTVKFFGNPHLRIDVRGPQQKATSIDENGNPVTPAPKIPNMRRPSQRIGEAFIYAAPLLLMDFTMIKKFAGVPISEIRASGNYLPTTTQLHDPLAQNYTVGRGPHLPSIAAPPLLLPPLPPLISSIGGGAISPSFLLPTLHNFTLTSPLQLTRALPSPHANPPSSRRVTLELFTSFIIYDTLFFLLHLSLHRIPRLARLHLPHHQHAEIHPQVTNHLSIAERLSLVLLANFSLNIVGSHVLTRTFFIPIFVYLLVEVHSGLDMQWGYEKVLPGGWGAGSKVHAQHHRSGVGGLAPFFAWWDKGLERWDGWRRR